MAKSGANVTMAIPFGQIGRRLQASTTVRAQMVLDTQVLKDTEPYVPYADGGLTDSARRASDIGAGVLRYATPYARRQYYDPEYANKSRDVHPLARMLWFEGSKAARLRAWVQVAKRTGGDF